MRKAYIKSLPIDHINKNQDYTYLKKFATIGFTYHQLSNEHLEQDATNGFSFIDHRGSVHMVSSFDNLQEDCEATKYLL